MPVIGPGSADKAFFPLCRGGGLVVGVVGEVLGSNPGYFFLRTFHILRQKTTYVSFTHYFNIAGRSF